jgi:hypothetical protein
MEEKKMKNFILENKIEYTKRISSAFEYYLYFLINNNKIVYVGQSRNLYERFIEHKRDKNFTHYFYFILNNDKRLRLKEKIYIKKFKPIYNKRELIFKEKQIHIGISLRKETYNILISESKNQNRTQSNMIEFLINKFYKEKIKKTESILTIQVRS